MIRMLNRQPHLLMLGLGVVKGLLHVQHSATGHACLIQDFDPMCDRLFTNFDIDLGVNLLAILKSQLVG